MVRRINAPIKPDDKGPEVANLQDALRLLLERKALRASTQSVDPTIEELSKLAEQLSHERAQSLYGDTCRRLTVVLQQQYSLGDLSGTVEERTADVLNELLKEFGALGEPDQWVVKGTVYAAGKPRAGVTVAAYDRDLRKRQPLGAKKTVSNGTYRIEYDRSDFQRADRLQRSGPWLIVEATAEGVPPAVFEKSQGVQREETVDLVLDVAAPSELEQIRDAVRPLLEGQGTDGGRLTVAGIIESDIEFLSAETGFASEQLRLFALAAKTAQDVQLIGASAFSEKAKAGVRGPKDSKEEVDEQQQLRIDQLEWIALYGWFREGQPQAFSELIKRPTDELAAALESAISRRIIPSLRTELKDVLRSSLDSRRIDEALKPRLEGENPSLGDVLATMPRRVSREKERALADILIHGAITSDDLTSRLKELDFDDKDIANIKVTRDLGDLTANHIPLMKKLQTLRADGVGDSIRYLSSWTPSDWLELAFEHGTPPSVSGGPQAYAAQLERAVETEFPTAVFAARVQSGHLELRDSAFKTAASFLASHPELELREANVREYINGDDNVSGARKEALIENLQKVQIAEKLSGDWREAGALLNAGFGSTLDVIGHGRTAFGEVLGNGITPERADEIYTAATELHDTTVSVIGDLYAKASPWVPDVFRSRPRKYYGEPVEDAELQEDEQPVFDNYPNMRRLFGNLTTCLCEHCQSVLSPAAYLVDLMRFLDPPRGGRFIGRQALHYLLERRPDIAHIELTCKNTNTEIPYIDLVLEVLENAIGLPIEIPAPYGFDPQGDLSRTPIPADVVDKLRRILQQSAISVGETLNIESTFAGFATFTQWNITDGARHWTLTHSPELMRTPRGVRLQIADAAQAAAMLDQGQLPDPAWVFEYASQWDSNLPIKGKPVVTAVEAGKEWRIQYTRAVRVELLPNIPKGTLILKTASGQELERSTHQYGVVEGLKIGLALGLVGEPLAGKLPSHFSYVVTQVGSDWEVSSSGTLTVQYQPPSLRIDSLTYQSSDSRGDLKASPENRNPEAYRKLNAAVYPWTLPFDLWLEEVRVFLQHRGVSRRELMLLCNPAGDTTNDTIVREVLGLSLAEWDIISSRATHQAWDYWGLKQNTNSVTDANDERVVTGNWLKVLTKVSILLQQSGLQFRELLNVLQTGFVRKEAPVLTPSGDECNPSKMELDGLREGHLKRIHHLVRLWRKLGWSIFDVDVALAAVTGDNMDLNTDTLRGLAQIRRLHELLGLPVYEIASWWTTLTANYRDYMSDKKPLVKSVYERLFLNPVIVNPPDRDFLLNAQATDLELTTGALSPKTSIITAALGITQSDFEALTADLFSRQEINDPKAPSSLTLSNLSALYRHASLAKSLSLSIGDYLRLRSLTGSKPLASVLDALRFVENAQFVARSGFSADELDYLMRYTVDAEPTSLFTAAFATQTLSDVRSALQSVRKETFGSAEPLVDHFRKTLTRIGWYEELVDEAVALFVPEGRSIPIDPSIPLDPLKVQIKGNAAVTVSIPLPLRTRVLYRAEDRSLSGSLKITAAGWNNLRSANSGTAEVIAAVAELRTNVEAFAKVLPEHLPRMQSFEVPTFTVEYDPATPPSIPAELSARCYFDTDAKRIVLNGWMTKAQRKLFRDSLPATDAAIATNLEQKLDEYKEPAGPNRFISHIDDLDEIEDLFSASETSATRVGKVLERVLPYLYRKALIEQLSRALDLEDGLVGESLSSQLDPASTLEPLLETQFVDSDDRVPPIAALFPAQFRALCKLHKAALLCSKLKIKLPQLKWLPTATSSRTFDVLQLDALPSRSGDPAPSLDAWKQLVLLFGLRDLRDGATLSQLFLQRVKFFLGVQAPTDVQQKVNDQHSYLAQALHSPVEDVRWASVEKLSLQWSADYGSPTRVAALFPLLINAWLARAVGLSSQDSVDASQQLNLAWPADFQNPRKLTELFELLLATQRLGAKCAELFSLTEDAAPVAPSPGNPGKPGKPGRAQAALARSLLRARYDEKTWPSQLKHIVDRLREKQRDALVSYLVARPPEKAVNRGAWKSANDLYEHYLIDTEMSPCRVSTRILHAISAVQLFVQRCLLNIEEDVKPSAIDERWKWIKNYRVWEANRKVFLYPENWIEPELRDDKSEIFKELEGQLQQDELDNRRAESVVKEYLRRLEGISNLMVLGLFIDRPIDTQGRLTGETQIHTVARTLNRPSSFFYRRWILSDTLNYWTAWEHVPLDGVKTDHVLPFVFNGEPYITWPETAQRAAPKDPSFEESNDTDWRLQMAWLRRTDGGWSDRYVTEDVIEHPWVYGKDVNSTFTFRVKSDQRGGIAIDCYAADRQSTGVKYQLPQQTKDPVRTKLRIGSSGVTFHMQITVTGYVSAEHRDPTDPNDPNKKAFAPVSNAYVKFYLDPSLYLGSPTDVSVDADIQRARALVQGDYKPDGSQGAIKEYDDNDGYTEEDGSFSLSLSFPVTDRRHGILNQEVLDKAKPKFRLEMTVDGKTYKNVFEYREQGDQNVYEAEQFYTTFLVKRGGPAPGSEVALTMNPIKRFTVLTSEDAVLEPLSGDPLSPLSSFVYGSGFRADATNQLDAPEEAAGVNVALWRKGPSLKHFLLPAAPVHLQSSSPVLYYRSSQSGYFIRKQKAPAGASGATGTYQILLDGDSRIRDLRRAVALDGPPALFGFEQEASPIVLDGHQAMPAVDVTTSFLQPGVRFEPDESSSPYAGYNTELFFHIPFLIAKFLSANQRFEEAQRWFHFIFDPTTTDTTPGPERYWRYLPFRKYSKTKSIDELLKILGDPSVPSNDEDKNEDKRKITQQVEIWLQNPFRPHAVARLRPRGYQLAVFFKYVSNLIEWGDHLFRQYTTESLNEATQLYILASKLLGQRPQTVPRRTSQSPLTYARVAGKWDAFSNAWLELEANVRTGKGRMLFTNIALPNDRFLANVDRPIANVSVDTGTSAISSVDRPKANVSVDMGTSAISSVGTLYFCVPRNEKMLEYWDTLDKRLFNIRHCRNIEGVEQPLPLFQPPIDPALLVRAVAAGLDIGAVLAEADTPLPHYRFAILAQKATELCNELKSLGGALLSALEKKDAEELSLLRSSQEIELLKLVRNVREQQLEEAEANIEALRQSEKLAAVRFAQYQRLLGKPGATIPDDDSAEVEQTSAVSPAGAGDVGEFSALGLTKAEQDQIKGSEDALRYAVSAGGLSTASGVAYVFPTAQAGTPFVSQHYGGPNIGAALSALSAFFGILERNASHQANRVATIGQHQRRQDDWVFQSRLALKEVQQVRKQMMAAKIRKDIATKELANHDRQLKNAEKTDRFMREKYTNRELYQWMVQQISAVYFRSYQLARDVAKRAEKAFRFELGLKDSNYIQFGSWDSLKKGLLAGEKLSHDLKRMEVAYLDQNKREYEITKHVSLRSINPIALIMLREGGQCEFEVPENLFDMDYPGHYLRRIKSVSVTIPCVTGPYTGVNCTLTLLKSRIRHATSLDGGYERDTTGDDRFTDGFGVMQSVVTTSAQNDAGLFEPNLRDDRYLPFEGAGVDSEWRLELPAEIRQFDYSTISDVILHIRYTARDAGPEVQGAAKALISERIAAGAGMVRLFSVRHDFPDAWAKFKDTKIQGAVRTAELRLDLPPEQYPFWSKGRLGPVKEAHVIARVGDSVTSVDVVEKADGTGKTDTLKDVLSKGLLSGDLKQLQPASPVTEKNRPLQLFFKQDAIEDLWIAIAWKGK